MAIIFYQIYKYFELNIIVIHDELIVPAKPVNKPGPKNIKILEMLKACLDKNQKE